jgi:acetyl-CoA synthetase
MRRILRKVAEGDIANLGDTSTLADPSVVDDLVRNRAGGESTDLVTVGGMQVDTIELGRLLETHDSVVEAACVGAPDGIHAYVVATPDTRHTDMLEADLKGLVRREVGPAAVPQEVRFVSALPRDKAGAVVRRILRKVAAGDLANLGDPAQLADPSVLELLSKSETA